ncbi:MAG: hypothetical protein AAFV25_20220 [Bacteroidota bacterium]
MKNLTHRSHSNKSIAVLPFVNMSADPDNEYFSDGITEEIINALTTVQGLKVIARLEQVALQKPDFALAHVSIHYGYNILAAAGLMPVQEVLTKGKWQFRLSPDDQYGCLHQRTRNGLLPVGHKRTQCHC